MFDLHLDVKTKKQPPSKLQIKALEKFNNFIGDVENDEATGERMIICHYRQTEDVSGKDES